VSYEQRQKSTVLPLAVEGTLQPRGVRAGRIVEALWACYRFCLSFPEGRLCEAETISMLNDKKGVKSRGHASSTHLSRSKEKPGSGVTYAVLQTNRRPSGYYFSLCRVIADQTVIIAFRLQKCGGQYSPVCP